MQNTLSYLVLTDSSQTWKKSGTRKLIHVKYDMWFHSRLPPSAKKLPEMHNHFLKQGAVDWSPAEDLPLVGEDTFNNSAVLHQKGKRRKMIRKLNTGDILKIQCDPETVPGTIPLSFIILPRQSSDLSCKYPWRYIIKLICTGRQNTRNHHLIFITIISGKCSLETQLFLPLPQDH